MGAYYQRPQTGLVASGGGCYHPRGSSQMLHLKNRVQLLRALPRRAIVAEIGVQRGRFAREIDRYARPSRLHLIDCWERQTDPDYAADSANVSDEGHQRNLQRARQRLRRGIRQGRVLFHRGYSVPTLATFPDRYFDWVYLDANHTFEGVTADLEACLPKLKPGGILTGHDYVNSPYWRSMNFGVVEAVEAFCRCHDWTLICLTDEQGNEIDRQGNPSFAICSAADVDRVGLVRPRSWWWPS